MMSGILCYLNSKACEMSKLGRSNNLLSKIWNENANDSG